MRKQRLRGIDAKKMKSCLENAAPGRNESWHFLQRELKEDNDVAKLKFGRSTYYKMLDSGVVQQKNLDEFVRYLNYLDKKSVIIRTRILLIKKKTSCFLWNTKKLRP